MLDSIHRFFRRVIAESKVLAELVVRLELYFPILEYDKGLALSEKNGRRLIDDAKILFEKKRYSSAVYLAIHGIEELGKALLFLKYKEKQKKITKSQWEKVFCDHKRKLKEVQEAITRHIGRVKVHEGFGSSKRYWSNERVQKILVEGLKRDKDDFAYVNYDFINQRFSNPSKLDKIDFERFTKGIVFSHTKMAIHSLESEKVGHEP